MLQPLIQPAMQRSHGGVRGQPGILSRAIQVASSDPQQPTRTVSLDRVCTNMSRRGRLALARKTVEPTGSTVRRFRRRSRPMEDRKTGAPVTHKRLTDLARSLRRPG